MKKEMVMTDANEATAHVAYRLNEVIAIYPSRPPLQWESLPISGAQSAFPTYGAQYPP